MAMTPGHLAKGKVELSCQPISIDCRHTEPMHPPTLQPELSLDCT
jgi:hypothetical protein